MICVTLTPDQFDEIVRDCGWKSGSLDFLSRVFVDGMDVSEAAKLSELSNSRGYNLASDFRKRYTAWLNERRLKTVVVFCPIDD
jgi:hypothetical protein